MKKSFKKILTILTALAIAFNVVPTTPAQAGEDKTAYVMYADSSWTYSYFSDPVDTGIVATDVAVKGTGDYTVGLDFTKTADGAASGMAFCAVGINGGEQAFPNYSIKINWIKINDKKINFTKGYTSSDDQKITRMNIYNAWVTTIPDDAHSYDGDISTASPTIVDPADFETVKTMFVNFTYYDEKGAPKDTPKDTKSSLSVSKTSVTIAPGKSATLSYKASGKVTVKSANTKVATVKALSGKKIKISVPKSAKKGATTTVTLKSGSKSVKVKVTVKK